MLSRRVRAYLTHGTAFVTFLAVICVPGIARAEYNPGCSEDNGQRIRVCIYQDYGTNYVQGSTNYLRVLDYRFRVTDVGGTQVSVTGSRLTMRAGVYGRCTSGCTGYRSGASVSKTITVTNGGLYTLAVPWRNATVATSNGGGYQDANAYVKYYFRGVATSFQTPGLCVGDIPSVQCTPGEG